MKAKSPKTELTELQAKILKCQTPDPSRQYMAFWVKCEENESKGIKQDYCGNCELFRFPDERCPAFVLGDDPYKDESAETTNP